MFNILGTETVGVINKRAMHTVTETFPAIDDVEILKGTLVKLNPDGTVEAAAVGDTPIGMVDVGTQLSAKDKEVTCFTQWVATVNMEAGTAIVMGDTLITGGVNADLGQIVNAATAGVIIGHALGDAAIGETVRIGLLQTFVTL